MPDYKAGPWTQVPKLAPITKSWAGPETFLLVKLDPKTLKPEFVSKTQTWYAAPNLTKFKPHTHTH